MEYKGDNDYELVYLIKEDNEQALNYVFEKYEPLIKKMAKYYYEMNKKIDFEDLVQEGRIGLYGAIKRYVPDKDVLFYTFAFLCIKRSIVSFVEKHNTNKNFVLTSALTYDEKYMDSISSYEEPLTLLEDNSLIEELINFKNSLDFIDANIFELRYSSFSYADISVLLEMPEKAIDNRLIKIKKKLKKYLFEINKYMI